MAVPIKSITTWKEDVKESKYAAARSGVLYIVNTCRNHVISISFAPISSFFCCPQDSAGQPLFLVDIAHVTYVDFAHGTHRTLAVCKLMRARLVSAFSVILFGVVFFLFSMYQMKWISIRGLRPISLDISIYNLLLSYSFMILLVPVTFYTSPMFLHTGRMTRRLCANSCALDCLEFYLQIVPGCRHTPVQKFVGFRCIAHYDKVCWSVPTTYYFHSFYMVNRWNVCCISLVNCNP